MALLVRALRHPQVRMNGVWPLASRTMRTARCGLLCAVAVTRIAALTTAGAASPEGMYSSVLAAANDQGLAFENLPGFTRSVVERDHALITPESRVWSSTPGWAGASTAHLVAPSFPMGAVFSMYMAKVSPGGSFNSLDSPTPTQRFVFVLEGSFQVDTEEGEAEIGVNDFAFFPQGLAHKITSANGGALVIYDKPYSEGGAQSSPAFLHGAVDDLPNLDTPGEVFKLKKCLPQTGEYDFNIHVMDFEPGEHLNIKEVHYNQHGLLLLQGKGIYRLGERWYPVQAGDAIWMAPFVPQWYAALGYERSRYMILKDANRAPGTY